MSSVSDGALKTASYVKHFCTWPFERCVKEILVDRNDFVEILHALLEVPSHFNDKQMEALWSALFVRLRECDEGICCSIWADAIRVLLERDLFKVVLLVDEFACSFFEDFAFDMIDLNAKQCLRAMVEKRSPNSLTFEIRSRRDRKKWLTLTEYADEQGCEWFAEVASAASAAYASKRVQ